METKENMIKDEWDLTDDEFLQMRKEQIRTRQREYSKRWRENNYELAKERNRMYVKNHYAQNKERILAAKKVFYEENKEAILGKIKSKKQLKETIDEDKLLEDFLKMNLKKIDYENDL
jgi:RPA family protein